MSMIDLNFLIDEPADVYHEKAKQYLSSHQLTTFMRCPYLYAKKRAGLVPDADSPAYFVGRAAHTRILEGLQIYEREYAIGGPINPSTGKPYGATTKKFLEWQEIQQKPVIPFEKADLIEAMNAGVRMNPVACQLLEHGKAEGVVRAKYRDFQSQIRIDWTNPELGIVDLKTCDDLTWFESDARRFNYVHQLAFYQAVLEQAIGTQVPVYIMAVEKKEPFRCGVWQVPEESLLLARNENEAAMERLRDANREDCFVTGYEELRYLQLAAGPQMVLPHRECQLASVGRWCQRAESDQRERNTYRRGNASRDATPVRCPEEPTPREPLFRARDTERDMELYDDIFDVHSKLSECGAIDQP